MKYRMDPKSGKELSALGFGCMRFPRKGISTDMQTTEQLILHAIENGVNYFDTAYIYPRSEVALGAFFGRHLYLYFAPSLFSVLLYFRIFFFVSAFFSFLCFYLYYTIVLLSLQLGIIPRSHSAGQAV